MCALLDLREDIATQMVVDKKPKCGEGAEPRQSVCCGRKQECSATRDKESKEWNEVVRQSTKTKSEGWSKKGEMAEEKEGGRWKGKEIGEEVEERKQGSSRGQHSAAENKPKQTCLIFMIAHRDTRNGEL